MFKRSGSDDPGAHAVALVDEFLHRQLVGEVARRCEHRRQRPAERTVRIGRGASQNGAPRRIGERVGVALVEHLEVSGDIRLERELVEEPFAEGVDRLDLQPARRLEGPGEEAARFGELGRVRPLALHLGDLLAERRVGKRRPFAEPVEDPLRHLGRRRLGEGEAEDAAGIGAGEQEADHPLRQDEGLARAGVGRHPGGGARVRGVGLRLPRGVVDGYGRIGARHSMSSSLSTSAHSRTRAR